MIYQYENYWYIAFNSSSCREAKLVEVVSSDGGGISSKTVGASDTWLHHVLYYRCKKELGTPTHTVNVSNKHCCKFADRLLQIDLSQCFCLSLSLDWNLVFDQRIIMSVIDCKYSLNGQLTCKGYVSEKCA